VGFHLEAGISSGANQLDWSDGDRTMPKRKRPEEKPKDQFKRFVDTATAYGVDDDKKVEASFRHLASKKPAPTKK
jgi:hypothetical protein